MAPQKKSKAAAKKKAVKKKVTSQDRVTQSDAQSDGLHQSSSAIVQPDPSTVEDDRSSPTTDQPHTPLAEASTAPAKRKQPSESQQAAKKQKTDQDDKVLERRRKKNLARRKAPAESIKDLEKWKEVVLKTYIPGINVIADKSQLHRKQRELAGYLGFDTTQGLSDMIDRHDASLAPFFDARDDCFQIPDWKPTSTIADYAIMEHMRGAIPGDRWYDLLKLKTGNLATESCPTWDDLKTDTSFARACWVAIVIHVIRADPKVFRESFTRLADANDQWLDELAPEDCYRALKFVRHYDFVRGAKQKGAYNAIDVKSTRINYLEYEEIQAATKAANVRDLRAPITTAKAQAQLLYEQFAEWNAPVHLDTTAATEHLVNEIGQTGDTLDDTTAGLSGKHDYSGPKLPPLDAETIKFVLQTMASRANILHDRPSDENDDVADEAISAANRLPTENNEDFVERMKNKAFWDVRNSLSTVTVQLPTIQEALRELTFDDQLDTLDSEKVFRPSLDHPTGIDPACSGSPLRPKVWQHIVAAWELRMEEGPLKGGINGLDCGMGKTIIQLLGIYVSGLKKLRRHLAGEKDLDFRPTAIVGTPPTVRVWHDELLKYFSNALKWKVFYGRQHDSRDLDMKSRLLPTNPLAAREEIEKAFPPDNPMSAFGVVIHSYDTMAHRTLLEAPKEKAEKVSSILEEVPQPRSDNPLMKTHLQWMESVMQGDPHQDKEPSEDHELEEAEAADAATSSEGTYHVSYFVGLYHRVVCDEAHRIKNARTKMFKSVYLMHAPVKWYVTATTLHNNAGDLVGALNLFWDDSFDEDLAALDDYEVEADDIGTYSSETASDVESHCPNYMEKYGDLHPYLFNPRRYARMFDRGLIKGEGAFRILRPILSRIQVKATMGTRFLLGDQEISAGDSVPRYRITGVELQQSPYEQARYNEIWKTFAPFLSQKGYTGEVGATTSGRAILGARGGRAMGIHRHLCHSTFDLHLHTLGLVKDEDKAQHVATWREIGGDGGFSQYYHLTKPTPHQAPPFERIGVAMYCCEESIKLRYLCAQILEANYDHDDKLLVYVNWPQTQWLTECFLNNLGISNYSLTTSLKTAEKDEMIKAFNDPDDRVRILIANLRSSSQSVNLQNACHRVLILDAPDSLNIEVQAFGRVHRFGQKHVQDIVYVCVLDTYDQWLYANNTEKMLAQVLAGAEIGEDTLKFDPLNRLGQDFRAALEAAPVDQGVVDMVSVDYVRDSRNRKFSEAAEEYIRRFFGMRTSRLGWRTMDLHEPHRSASASHAPFARKDGATPPPSTTQTPLPPRLQESSQHHSVRRLALDQNLAEAQSHLRSPQSSIPPAAPVVSPSVSSLLGHGPLTTPDPPFYSIVISRDKGKGRATNDVSGPSGSKNSDISPDIDPDLDPDLDLGSDSPLSSTNSSLRTPNPPLPPSPPQASSSPSLRASKRQRKAPEFFTPGK